MSDDRSGMPLVSEERLGDLLGEEAKNRRLDRLCVIAAGVASVYDEGWFQEENAEMTAAIIARASRAILAKLEEE